MFRGMLTAGVGLSVILSAAPVFAEQSVVAATRLATPAATLGRPVPPRPVGGHALQPAQVRAQMSDRESELYNRGVVTHHACFGGDGPGWWNQTKEFFSNTEKFQSDRRCNFFISPLSNPFYFEDPRALTEVKILYFHQGIPGSNFAFGGGSADFFGLQARLAIGPWFSIVLNKLGWIWLDPKSPSGDFQNANGLAELNLGPKFTFWTNEASGTVAAAGLTFQVPVGSSSVFQSNGSLGLVPYLSLAQSFGRSDFGNFNFITSLGYALSVDRQRAEHFFSSFHLDYALGNKFFPFVELNWFTYTKNGDKVYNVAGSPVPALGFEGRDLINFGTKGVSGNNDVSLALGARFKFNESLQLGGAFEFPVTGRRDLLDYRVLVDLILRY